MNIGQPRKPQRYVCSAPVECPAECNCQTEEQWAALLSRRSLLGIAAAAAATPPLLANRPAGAQGGAASKISATLAARVVAAIDADATRLQGIFRDVHQNAELGFMETRTAGIVANEFRALGYDVKTGIAQTGVVGILRNGAGPTVMYRADMDANAVEEATGLPYASRVRVKRADGIEVPVSHMCGHDAHVIWMLGLAKAMAALRSEWSGTLVLVGQPAEELGEGAAAMVADGLYGRHGVPAPDMLLGLHTAPIPTGAILARNGTLMAGTDQIDVTFHGVGGHGSSPHLARDPVVMAALAITQYQTIVSRTVNAQEMAVLTVGAVQAGTDNNVIPESALLKINLRFFDMAVRQQMIDGIRAISNGIARSSGMPEDRLPTIVMKGHAPVLVNNSELMERLRRPLRALLGDQRVIEEFPAFAGSEDVQLLRADRADLPIAFTFVGIAEPAVFERAVRAGRQVPFANHNPNYLVDLASIPVGAKIGTLKALELLAK